MSDSKTPLFQPSFASKPTPVPHGVVPEPCDESKGELSVWTFPRPAEAVKCPWTITIDFDGERIYDNNTAWMVLETSHPPTYYFPQEDLKMERFQASDRKSYCEWKGTAKYYHMVGKNGARIANGAWYYPDCAVEPQMNNHVAMYVSNNAMSATVDGEEVTPQPGQFYGGWVTKRFKGPIKGEPQSMYW